MIASFYCFACKGYTNFRVRVRYEGRVPYEGHVYLATMEPVR